MFISTRKYTSITEKLFLASQRPYIGIRTYNHNFLSDATGVLLETKIQNYGNTPAKNIDVLTEVFVDEIKIEFDNLKVENQIIFPQSSHPISMIIKNKNMFLAIKNGQSLLKIHTKITYSGITDKKYGTEEICKYNHKSPSFVGEFGEWR